MDQVFSERIVAGALLLSLILPVPVMLLLAVSTETGQKRKYSRIICGAVLVMNLWLNSAAVCLVYARFSGSTEPVSRLTEIARMECSYQDFWPVVKTSLAGMIVSFAAGFGIRFVLQPRAERKVPRKAAGKLMMIAAAWVSVLLLGSSMSLQSVRHLRMTEICRKTTALVDASGRDDGHTPVHHDEKTYITLENDGIMTCTADQIFFSEDTDQPRKYGFEDLEIPPRSKYTVVVAYQHLIDYQDDDETDVLLSDQQGRLLDRVSVPVLADEERYVLDRESGSWRVSGGIPQENGTVIAVPVFSHPGGFYDQPFDLTITADEGTRIYYTLDGSTPDPEAFLYEGPVHVENRSGEPNRYRSVLNVVTDYLDKQDQMVQEPVDKAIVVRAAAADDQGRMSEVVTQTYFVELEKYQDGAVVSIIADPADFFGEDGIYVTGKEYDAWYEENAEWISANPKRKNDWIWEDEPEPNFMKRGDAWERAGNVELLERGQELMNQPAGFAVSGSSTRDTFFKRLNVYARNIYGGSALFEIPVFGEKKVHSFALRRGFLNAFVPALVGDRDLAVLRSFPVTLFLNGEYWCETYLCEKYHASYFSETYGVKESNVRYLKISRESGMTEDETALYEQEFRNFFRENDLSDPGNYEEFCRRADIQSYIDFLCVNLYVNNEDMTDTQNIVLWRVNEPEGGGEKDGRWRWGLYDMDLRWGEIREAQGVEHDYEANTFSVPIAHIFYGKSYADQPMYRALRRSPAFRRQFVLTFMDLVNTDFRPENVLARLAEWGVTGGKTVRFFKERPNYIVPYMAEEFGLKGSLEAVTVSAEYPEGGRVFLNTIQPDLTEGSWSGNYYTDYPLTLKAEAEEGYRFAGWEINGVPVTEPEAEAEVKKGGTEIHALFERQ